MMSSSHLEIIRPLSFGRLETTQLEKEHMREMRLLKEALDPSRGRFMGCRTINTEDVLVESEYVGTMLNRHAARFFSRAWTNHGD